MHRDDSLKEKLMSPEQELNKKSIVFMSGRGQVILDPTYLIPPRGQHFPKSKAIYAVLIQLRPRSNIRERGKEMALGSDGVFHELGDLDGTERRYADLSCLSMSGRSSAMLIATDAADCCLYFTKRKALSKCITNIHQYGFQEGMKQCMQITQ